MKSTRTYRLIAAIALFACSVVSHAQMADTSSADVEQQKVKKERTVRSPKKASLYSAILPGAGQVYNKKYWKLPIVYGAMATAVYFYFNNRSYYIEYRDAYLNDLNFDDPDYEPSFYALRNVGTTQLRQAADASRQNMEYSVIGFLAIYGLQIIDATVDAHLSSFDIGDDLTLEWEPTVLPRSNHQIVSGLRLDFRF
ncbi:MAG: DUF5683 domain-containing protein [Cryomorphaceae bacterium]